MQWARYNSWRGWCGCQQCSASIIEVEVEVGAQRAVEVAVECSVAIHTGMGEYTSTNRGTIIIGDTTIMANDDPLVEGQVVMKPDEPEDEVEQE